MDLEVDLISTCSSISEPFTLATLAPASDGVLQDLHGVLQHPRNGKQSPSTSCLHSRRGV